MSKAEFSAIEYEPPLNRKLDEELLAIFDIYQFTREQVGQIRVSPDNRHIAYVGVIGSRFQVTVDRQSGEVFQHILKDSLTFGPDSRRFAYVAANSQTNFVIVDDKKHGPYDGIINCSPAFSPDSKHVAYAAMKGSKIVVFSDEDSVGSFNKVGDVLVFSPDSRCLAFRAAIDRKQCTIVDGNEGPHYDLVDNPHFSPDSQRIAYIARLDDKWFIVIDGREGKPFKNVVGLTFSPDSKQIAYYAQGDDGWYLAVDDQLIGPYHTFGRGDFGLFKYSPDGSRIAFVGVEIKKRLIFSYGHKEFVAVNGSQGKSYNRCGNLVFSPDSQHLAYLALADGGWYVVVDNKEYGPYEVVDVTSPVFSPDSQRFAYSARTESYFSPFVDGVALGEYHKVFTPVFSPDNNKVAYTASHREVGDQVIINENRGKIYDRILLIGGGQIVFDSQQMLHYIANGKDQRDHWYLVTETI